MSGLDSELVMVFINLLKPGTKFLYHGSKFELVSLTKGSAEAKCLEVYDSNLFEVGDTVSFSDSTLVLVNATDVTGAARYWD